MRSAVQIAKAASRKYPGEPCATLGPLIHNPQVLEQLAKEGVRTSYGLDDIDSGTVVIRSHGVGKALLDACYAKGLVVADATCPHVKRMHRMVAQAEPGLPVIIVGRADHPEVQGTAGWAQGPVTVVESVEAAESLPEMRGALVVAQTTIPNGLYRSIIRALERRVDRLTVLDTVCPATAMRQAEARELAQWANMMLVVGSSLSSNTRELYETCRARCPRTILIESLDDIPEDIRMDSANLNDSANPMDNSPARSRAELNVGITAGASTPDWLYKEVVNRMNDKENVTQATVDPQAVESVNPVDAPKDASADADANASFMADIEATLVKIRPGQTVTGTVVQVTEDEICVNIGFKSDGLVKRGDLINKDVKVGDEIDVEVIKVNDGEGNVLLSQRNVVSRKNWDALMAKYDANEFIEGVGKEAVKGGLIANVLGVRAFIPASQLSQRYVDKIEDFVGKPMKLKIIEVDRSKKRIVCSRKAAIAEEVALKKKEAWSRLNEGEVIMGTVRRLTDFGAFVDIGGVDGLVHVTDLSWGRVRHPNEVVQPGQEIQVKVLALDPERERIQLGYKQTQPRPWDIAEEKYPPGLIVEGRIVRTTTFGAFVELEPGLDGLVHISQCALSRIAKVEDAVEVGQVVRVKVLGVDPVAKRISLSIRAVLEDEAFIYSNDIPGEGFDTVYSDEVGLAE
ncbi:MAG: bifunctional 4-hydroxy-3-methylbut-2-enyl diphosphate reductase/30S ribosomal protein S1 [Oscillospiraceae bacterium]|nr:bifunctional 4-hydroxy-3-methylbut-2-enyl diphosphate reductase/30S ribosomal protein S1 [Oscillospiraceae bacterium]